MRLIHHLLIFKFAICTCTNFAQASTSYESDILRIEQITTNTFIHTSYLHTEEWGAVPCNGMVYINDDKAIVFDAPTNDSASIELINWIGDKDIIAIVVTHFHVDCLGGLQAFHEHNIQSYASNKTIGLAMENNNGDIPLNGFDSQREFEVGREIVLAKYFGEGHTQDNTVGYIASENTLFGGCLIKALNASKGNLEDANTSDWSQTVRNIKTELPDLQFVIPGHGKAGNAALLDYTIELFNEDERFLFFLHNRFLENHTLEQSHPQYGRVEYNEILDAFAKAGLNVISEKRSENINAREYALLVVSQIDSLIQTGVRPDQITVVGTSKGGYIAQYVSTMANNPELNFVFIASFQESDIQGFPEINYCGNILTIFELTDPLGVSAIERHRNSTCENLHYREIALNTQLKHGFLFKALSEWIVPTIHWAKGNYEFEE